MTLSDKEFENMLNQLEIEPLSQCGISVLNKYDGDINHALEEALMQEYGSLQIMSGKSLKNSVLKVMRRELCASEGFKGKISNYIEKPEHASLLTGAIAYILESVSLPFTISPAISTLVVLYILKFGIDVFCDYTECENIK